ETTSFPRSATQPAASNQGPRVIVIGLDGAPWSLIDPLLDQNRLPTLARLIGGGTRAALRSCIQPSSEQAWSAFATGMQNGKFGLYGFYQRAAGSYSLEYINASHRRAPTLWRLLSDRGKRSIVVNVPLTWPVERIQGALISGLMTPGPGSDYTWPRELKDELGEYIIDVDIERGDLGSDDAALAGLVAQVKRMSELQTRATLSLMQRVPDWNFLTLVHRAPDILCHKFWRYQDASHPLYNAAEAAKWGGVIADAFEYLDRQLGEILTAAMDERTTVLVISDHGFGPLTHAVYLNKYFAQRGLLAYRAKGGSPLGAAMRAGVRRLNNPLVHAVKQRAFEILPGLKGDLHYSMAYGNIDWSRTRAYAVGTMGNIYLNLRGREPHGAVEPGEYESTRDDVIAAMRALSDPETGRSIFDAVYCREEIYQGPALKEAPDVVGLIDGPYHVAAVDWRGEGAGRQVVQKLTGGQLLFVSDTSGQHRMDGILAAAGPAVRAGARFEQPPRLIDVAPTILQILGEPVPSDMDGRVLIEMLSQAGAVEFSSPEQGEKEASGAYTKEEARAIEERLAGLGYLG
ncbi:MAG: alkaline phosphatase family protein, partial [Rudaea sp.]